MKKTLIGIAALALLASCAGGQSEEKAREDSIRRIDSIAQAAAAAEQARLDSIRQDSIMMEEIEVQFKNPISLTPGKKAFKQLPEHTDKIVNWPLTLVNNTSITLSPSDYKITYIEEFEDMDAEGTLDFYTKNRTLKGPELAPGATATATIHDNSTEDVRNPRVKLTISKEEFIRRYKEAKQK